MEPAAAPLSLRFENFLICKKMGIFTCLYLKPATQMMMKDLALYVDVVKRYQPDFICIGVKYGKYLQNSIRNRKDYPFPHPVHPDKYVSNGLPRQISTFRKKMQKELSTPIFHSSVCVSAFLRNWPPKPHIWKDFPLLCVKCRDCEGDFKKSAC